MCVVLNHHLNLGLFWMMFNTIGITTFLLLMACLSHAEIEIEDVKSNRDAKVRKWNYKMKWISLHLRIYPNFSIEIPPTNRHPSLNNVSRWKKSKCPPSLITSPPPMKKYNNVPWYFNGETWVALSKDFFMLWMGTIF